MALFDPTSAGLLSATAATIAVVHTLAGPDHYLPFVAMSRCGGWSLRKTALVTALCGLGHVLSSVVLGLLGIALGSVVFVNSLEESRGAIAGWLLLAFGLTYTVYGLVRAARNRPHRHVHGHANGTVHDHEHVHVGEHLHVHAPAAAPESAATTPWILFTIFLFGPCEPLIPLVMVPAARGGWAAVAWVSLVFGAVTILTMTTIVLIAQAGLHRFRWAWLEQYGHAAAGATVALCGVAVVGGL